MNLSLSESILEHLPCGCIVFEADGKITYVNPVICEILGYSSNELVGLELEGILTISSRIFCQTHIFPILRLQGKVNEISLNLKAKASIPVPVLVNVKAKKENDLISYVGTFSTVWERQKYEQELIKSKKAQERANKESDETQRLSRDLELNRQQLDSNLALLSQRNEEYLQIGKVLTHDMQEPVRKIALSFQILLDRNRIKQNSDDVKNIDVISRSIFRLRTLTHALYDFVTLNSEKEDFEFISVTGLIIDAELEVRQLFPVQEFTVRMGKMHGFFGRPAQIKRVFVELLKNAVQNRYENRPLLIQIDSSLVKSNSYQVNKEKYNYINHVQIEFSDNGIGFESRFESQVFNLSSKLNKNSDGIGLGLTLCKQIISQHHGVIKVSSELGVGSKFTILVPANPS